MRPDEELVKDSKQGDREAFSELVRRHQRGLLRLALRFCHDLERAEDVVQESFLKAYQKIGMFEGRSSFKSWLYRIAINTAKNRLRDHKEDTVSMDRIQIATEAIAEKQLLGRDLQGFVKRLVDALPERQRLSVVLHIYEDLSFKEISEVLDCPYDTAKANYRHGIIKIKAAVEGNNLIESWYEMMGDEALEVHEITPEVES